MFGEADGARERPRRSLGIKDAKLSVVLCGQCCRTRARDRERIPVERDVHVLEVHAGQIGFEDERRIRLVVEGGGPLTTNRSEHMHRITLIVTLSAVCMGGSYAQTNPAIITTAEIVSDITMFKRYVLLDTARIDSCGLRDAFDANGLFRQPADVTSPPRYSDIGQCRASEGERQGPVVLRAAVVGDTVVVSGYTKRGSFGFTEEFRYTAVKYPRSPQSRWVRLYTITATIDS